MRHALCDNRLWSYPPSVSEFYGYLMGSVPSMDYLWQRHASQVARSSFIAVNFWEKAQLRFYGPSEKASLGSQPQTPPQSDEVLQNSGDVMPHFGLTGSTNNLNLPTSAPHSRFRIQIQWYSTLSNMLVISSRQTPFCPFTRHTGDGVQQIEYQFIHTVASWSFAEECSCCDQSCVQCKRIFEKTVSVNHLRFDSELTIQVKNLWFAGDREMGVW